MGECQQKASNPYNLARALEGGSPAHKGSLVKSDDDGHRSSKSGEFPAIKAHHTSEHAKPDLHDLHYESEPFVDESPLGALQGADATITMRKTSLEKLLDMTEIEEDDVHAPLVARVRAAKEAAFARAPTKPKVAAIAPAESRAPTPP